MIYMGVVHVIIGLDSGFSSVRWRVTLLIIDVNNLCLVHFVWMILNEIFMKLAEIYMIFTRCACV